MGKPHARPPTQGCWQERGLRGGHRGGWGGQQQGSPPPFWGGKKKEVKLNEKRIPPPLTQVFSIPLKMTVEKKRQGWKATRKKARFTPRELKPVSRASVSQRRGLRRGRAGTGPEPGLLALLITPLLLPQKTHWQQGRRPKATRRPASLALLSHTPFLEHGHTPPRCTQLPSLHEAFPDLQSDTLSSRHLCLLVTNSTHIYLLHVCHVRRIFLDA